jgi:hypothetical protein
MEYMTCAYRPPFRPDQMNSMMEWRCLSCSVKEAVLGESH